MNLEKERTAIERLKAFEPPDGYYLAYSGGKDSDAILILAKLAGVKFDAVHNLTTADAPETIYYIKSHPEVQIEKAFDKNGNHITMWNLIEKKMIPPTRVARYCCEKLKERGGKGRVVMTGVRWSESPRRKENANVIQIIGAPKATIKTAEEIGAPYRQSRQGGITLNDDNVETRRLVEHCYRTTKTMVNPIVDWSTDDVWDFLNHYGCKSNPLYQCGFNRIGCIGCPMIGKHRYWEFRKYPKYKRIYIATFDRMLQHRKEKGKNNTSWQNGVDVFRWWMGEDFLQTTLFDNFGDDI